MKIKGTDIKNMKADEIIELIVNKIAELDILDYEKYLDELSNIGVKLDEDPIAAGLTSLNAKTAQIDAQKTRVGYILTKAIKNENNIDIVNSFVDRIYEKRRADLLQSPDIAKLSNQSLRDAAVTMQLDTILDLQSDIKQMLSKAKIFTKITQQTLNMLEGTNKNISRQLTTIQVMTEIGEIIKRDPNWDK